MTSKQRAYLKSLAMKLTPALNVGKDGLTDGIIEAVKESLEANELVKIGVLKNCTEDSRALSEAIASFTRAEVVQIIGKKIVLFKVANEKEHRHIVLPKVKQV